MLKRLAYLLVASGIATQLLRRLGATRQHRMVKHERRLDKIATQRWEDEGGTPTTPRYPT